MWVCAATRWECKYESCLVLPLPAGSRKGSGQGAGVRAPGQPGFGR